MNPKVSIIVPNYNHALFLKQRLDSIFRQTYQNFEVILLDDASTDDSLEVLKTYKNHNKISHVIFNDSNSGSTFKQWKKGVDLATGELIWIAESDDYNDSKFLEIMVATFKEDIGICYSQSLDVDEQGEIINNRFNYTKDFVPNIWENDFTFSGLDFIKKFLIIKNVIPNASAVVFKKELVDNTILSSSILNMRMCGDWFFWMKLCAKTNIRFVNCNLNFIRNHSNMTRNHSSKTKKKTRLLEEVSIRNYIFNEFTVKSEESNKMVYISWFKIHNWRAFFNKSFYDILLDTDSKILFLKSYFIFKLKAFLK